MTDERGPLARFAPWVFLFLAAALFPRALIGQTTFFHYDTWMQNLTFRAWWFEQLRDGHFATWCPGMFAGYPLFAETQTGPLYPTTFLLFSVLPATIAFSWSVILHFAFAGWGAYLVMRRLGVGVAGAMFAGVAFEWSGFLVTHVVHFNLLVGAAWTPWVVWLALGVAGGSRRATLGLAASVAALLLGAHPYTTIMNLGVAAVTVLCAGPGARTVRSLGAVIGSTALGVTIAAIQVLPTRAFLPQTSRGEGMPYDFLTFGSFPLWNLVTLAAPDAYGTPVTDTFWAGPDWSHYAETCAYVGLVTLALAVVAIALRRDRATLFATIVLTGSLLLMLGRYTPVYRILSFIPVLESTRLPGRFALPFTFALIMLAGLGLDALRSARNERAKRALITAAIVVGALAAGAAWEMGPARDPSGEVVGVGRAWSARLPAYTGAAKAASTRLAVEVLATFGLLFALSRSSWRRPALLAAPVLVGIALFTWGRSFNPQLDRATLETSPPVVEALPDVSPRPRVFRQGVAEQWARVAGQPRTDLMTPGWKGNEASYASGAWTLPPNSHLLYGVDSGEGFTSLLPSAWLEWMGLSNRPGATPRPDLNEAQADLLAIDAVLSTGSGIAGEGWTVKSLPGDVYLSLHANPMPRVRLARAWETLDRDALLARLRDPTWDPRRAVLLEASPKGVAESASAGVTDEPLPAREIGPGHWQIDVPPEEHALVILAERFDPDWVARDASGQRIEILRAEGLLLGFVAPAAGGTVELKHAPSSVRWGAVVSAAGLALLLGGTLVARRKGLRSTLAPASELPASRRAARFVLTGGAVLAVGSFLVDLGDAHRDRRESGFQAAAVRSWTGEALAAYQAGALPAAADLLRAAERLSISDPEIPYRLGLVERRAGREGEAQAAFARALDLDPGFAPARDALAADSQKRF